MGNDDDDVERGKMLEQQPLQEGQGESQLSESLQSQSSCANFISTLMTFFHTMMTFFHSVVRSFFQMVLDFRKHDFRKIRLFSLQCECRFFSLQCECTVGTLINVVLFGLALWMVADEVLDGLQTKKYYSASTWNSAWEKDMRPICDEEVLKKCWYQIRVNHSAIIDTDCEKIIKTTDLIS